MEENISYFISKAMRFCSAKEVCIAEMSDKLLSWGLENNKISLVIEKLKNENFIDEKRYANAFTQDKFEFNNWGKQKIKFELSRKNIPQLYITEALNQLDSKKYFQKAEKLFIIKFKNLKEENLLKKKQKIFSYLSNKGFETDIIYQIAENKFSN